MGVGSIAFANRSLVRGAALLLTVVYSPIAETGDRTLDGDRWRTNPCHQIAGRNEGDSTNRRYRERCAYAPTYPADCRSPQSDPARLDRARWASFSRRRHSRHSRVAWRAAVGFETAGHERFRYSGAIPI